ncbi:glycosyltransferase family 4 protein [Cognatiyoonia sp. IB215446]|uniref:glycosyltransferase family 4 protein n=1 Tax=Cognatiyoonia sp. IB215446 TaxID=3097355 RepID=UPI002A163981|nr:glycosyltransferase family 4 protein [Cognatiyoonia sp. IB215446]MDX8349243.1 glycosyltransferase family 4 protein [Cognatiyoonia sp. IB215446]
MALAYLMNTYPITSTTFVRREIHAHEAAGMPVKRFAIRNWGEDLVDPRDRDEIGKTTYILQQGAAALIGRALKEAVTNPLGFARAFGTMVHLATRPGSTGLKNAAYLIEAVFFKQAARAAGIHHVHAHFSTNSAAVALLARRMGGPSYSFTAHGPDEFDDPAANGLPVKVEHAAFVAAITDYARGVILQATGGAGADKVQVVRCGIDLDEFSVTPPPENKRVVCVGRLCPAKAQVLLVEAVAPLVADHPELELVFIGDGEDRAGIEARIAELGLQDHVSLPGWGTGDEVRAAIKGARIFALPSFAEGLPIVLMESLAMGRAVVTTQITGIPELVDDKVGWIVPPGDVSALRGAIKNALSADEATLAALGATGAARVGQAHDQSRNAAKLRKFFPRQNS